MMMGLQKLFLCGRHVKSLARGPNAALDQILTGPHGLIHKMNRIRPAASIVVKCGPTDIPLTTCGPPGQNLDTLAMRGPPLNKGKSITKKFF